jgi:hypothetical protein
MFRFASVPPPLSTRPAAEHAEDDDVDIFLLQAELTSGPGTIAASHILIVADHGLALLRGLIRRGCPAATCIKPAARSESDAYDLVCFPDVTRGTDLERLIRDALRATAPNGRLIARVIGDPDGRVARGLVRRLKLIGFIHVQNSAANGRDFLRAELSNSPGAAERRHGSARSRLAELRGRRS